MVGMRETRPPPVIYLPSSGGHTGSRITPELVARRRFPFRRYSIQEDGSLAVRVKHLNRDVRPRPYTRMTIRFNTPPPRHASVDPEPTFTARPTTSTSDPTITMELLKNLVPALIEDPASFERSISSICAAHNIDESVVSAVVQAARRRPSIRPLEHTQTLDCSTPPAVVPSSSTSPATVVSLVPFKHERPLSSGHRGTIIWYTTQSHSDVSGPTSGIPEIAGNLYIHRNISTSTNQVWLFGREARWTFVPDGAKVNHPTVVDRVLNIRLDGSPSWVTVAGFTNTHGRKARASGGRE